MRARRAAAAEQKAALVERPQVLTLARAYGMASSIDWRPLGRIVVHVALFSLFVSMLLPWALAVPVLGWKVLFGLVFGGECAHPPDLL